MAKVKYSCALRITNTLCTKLIIKNIFYGYSQVTFHTMFLFDIVFELMSFVVVISEQRLDAAITRSSQSVAERRRRGSADDGQPHQMYQQTIHGRSTDVFV